MVVMQKLVLIACAFALFFLSVAGDVCDSGIYALLKPLSSYPKAQQWCAQNFPPATVTVAVAANTKAKRAAATSTTATTASKAKSSISNSSPTTSKASAIIPSSSPTTTSAAAAVSAQQNNKATPSSTTTTTQDPMSALLSQCTNGPRDIASTFCSCIEHHPTAYKSTTTNTSSKTTTVSLARSILDSNADKQSPEQPLALRSRQLQLPVAPRPPKAPRPPVVQRPLAVRRLPAAPQLYRQHRLAVTTVVRKKIALLAVTATAHQRSMARPESSVRADVKVILDLALRAPQMPNALQVLVKVINAHSLVVV